MADMGTWPSLGTVLWEGRKGFLDIHALVEGSGSCRKWKQLKQQHSWLSATKKWVDESRRLGLLQQTWQEELAAGWQEELLISLSAVMRTK